MAGPHVAGLAALLLSADPTLTVDELELIIRENALPRTTGQSCGDVPGTQIPNNTFGYGRIDAFASFLDPRVTKVPMLNLTKQASASTVSPGEILTYTLTVDYSHSSSPAHNIVLTDRVPAGTTLLSATSPYTHSSGVVEWRRPSLETNASWVVTMAVQVSPTATAVVNEKYRAASSEASAVGRPVTTTVVAATPLTLTVGKKASAAWTRPGELLTYTLTVSYAHPHSATQNVTLSDLLPQGTVLVTATKPFVYVGGEVRWSTPSLAPQSSWKVTLTVLVSPTLEVVAVVNDDFVVWSDEEGPTAGAPVTTPIVHPRFYFPFLGRETGWTQPSGVPR